ncbi:glutathione S-transferase family protein [Roseovarius nitratireducens]|jgi:glutathione S-transferase|uniref:glutathione S-transferase family protein n=1 Tax=Roseovarius nitratireducens TaxID=2044597 RepID=UPI000CE1DD7E|nr:glutathione S-transferase family protein [Roseovarius nitratireducens]
MILIGRYLSPFTRRVAVSLKLLGLPFERRPLTAWHDLEELRRLNPVGRVPALILDDGEMIFESSAILDEIDRIAGPDRALLPAAGPARREALRVTAVALGVMDKAAAARYERVMRPKEKVHQPWIDHNIGQVMSGLGWLEERFADTALPPEMSQPVISTVVAHDFLAVAMAQMVDLQGVPALRALSQACADLPAFAETRPEIDL